MKINILNRTWSDVEYNFNNSKVVIGRGSHCDLQLCDESLSRKHVLVSCQDDVFKISDLDSSNGVFIDGNLIPKNREVTFFPYQTITLGTVDLQFSFEQSFAKIVQTGQLQSHSKTAKVLRANPKRMKKNVVAKENKSFFYLSLLISCFVFVALIYGANTQASQPNGTPTRIIASQKVHSSLPELLYDNTFYLKKFDQVSCRKWTTECDDLRLSEDFKEGVEFLNGEYFIFINLENQSEVFKNNKFNQDASMAELAAFYKLLKSELFDRFMSKKVTQIHLVFFKSEHAPHRVYRFHPSSFKTNRTSMIQALGGSLNTGKSDTFWTLLNDKVPSLEI